MYRPKQGREREQNLHRPEPRKYPDFVVITLSSGAITLVELRTNPLDDTERGEWSNKLLYYGLICVISFIIACLYLPALYFAPYLR